MDTEQTIINSLILGDKSGLNIIVLSVGITLGITIFRTIKTFRHSQKFTWLNITRVLLISVAFGGTLIIRFNEDISLLLTYFRFVFIPAIICFLVFYYIKYTIPLMKLKIEPSADIYPWMVKSANIALKVIYFGLGMISALIIWSLLETLIRG